MHRNRPDRARALRVRLIDIISRTAPFPPGGNDPDDPFYLAARCGGWLVKNAHNFSVFHEEVLAADVSVLDFCLNMLNVNVFLRAMIHCHDGERHQTDTFLKVFALFCADYDVSARNMQLTFGGDAQENIFSSTQFWFLMDSVRARLFPLAAALLHGSERHGVLPLSLEGADRACAGHMLRHGTFEPPYPPCLSREEVRANVDPAFWRRMLSISRTDESIEFVLNELRHALPDGYISLDDMFPQWVQTSPQSNYVLNHLKACLAAYLDCVDDKETFRTDDFVAFICSTTPVEI